MKKISILIFLISFLFSCTKDNDIKEIELTTEEVINYFAGSSLYILGDSYSTFRGWIPKHNISWYPQPNKTNDVQDVEKTWWFMLCKKLNLNLIKNNSFSGSTICNTGYRGEDASMISYIKRMKDDFGESFSLQPRVIIIYGGLNDFLAHSPLGDRTFSNWTESDFKETLPSICYMFYYLKYWSPNAIIINICDSSLKKEIKNTFKEAAAYYGIYNIVLKSISLESGHPNMNGMISIRDQIMEFLKSILINKKVSELL